jgi:anti-sigma B factor antagonist
MTLSLSKSESNGWQVIAVEGQVDSKTVTSLRDFIDQELQESMPVALNLSAVPFMSSAGLRTLLTLHRRTQDMEVDLALVGIAEEIADTMRITGFYDYFTVYPSLAELPQRS